MYLLKASTDMPGVLGLATALASGTSISDFDSTSDPLVVAAFDSLHNGGDDYNPKWTIDSASTAVSLGTLKPGESLDCIYQLTTRGTTNGGERGFDAFLGDPFNVQINGDLLAPVVTLPVPEPATAGLLLLGLGGLAWWRRPRT